MPLAWRRRLPVWSVLLIAARSFYALFAGVVDARRLYAVLHGLPEAESDLVSKRGRPGAKTIETRALQRLHAGLME